MKKWMILDANSILNRAFYAIRMLNARNGQPTNAIFGFLNILFKYCDMEQPDGICAAFDLRAPTFRHTFYDQYKAQRKGMPEELAAQLEPMKQILRGMGIPVLEKEGFEADDIIGTVSARCEQAQIPCVILTGDKDDLQLAGPYTTIKLIRTVGGKTQEDDFTPEKVQEVYGLTPTQFIDLKAIMGDTSDNIPGVAGIGEKGALSLMQEFGSLEEIYAQIDHPSIKPKMREKLLAGKQAAFDSRFLATIDRKVPLSFQPDCSDPQKANLEQLLPLLESLDMHSFLPRFQQEKHQTPVTELSSPDSIHASETAYLLQEDGLWVCDGTHVYHCAGEGKTFFENPAIAKIGYDTKADRLRLWKAGIQPQNLAFDIMLAAYIINQADVPLSLEKVTERYAKGAFVQPVEALWHAYSNLKTALEQANQTSLYYELELPLVQVLAEMEQTGVHIDRDMVITLSHQYQTEIEKLEQAIYTLAGESFNINSTKQLGEILFQKLKLPVYKKNKTGPSTDSDTLERLAPLHDIIPLLMEYRTITKLKSTYLDGMLPLIDADERLHTNYNQAATQTGRLSSTEPNLQNLPIRREEGRHLRKLFCAPEGKILLDADYSQIELRILAHMAQDEAMIRAFLEGIDIHTQTAAYIFQVDPRDITPTQRSSAKAVNFGIVYGIGEFSLAKNIRVSRAEAKRYIDTYKQTYSGITAFMERTVEQAKETGFVETAFGRRRYIPELSAGNFVTRSFGERAAMNAPVQGTSADVIKLAMVRVQKRLQEASMEARLILQIHDELVLELPEEEKEQAEQILRYEMEHAVSFDVPLTVEVHAGKSLFDTK